MFLKDDFIHGDTLAITPKGLKYIKSLKHYDEIGVLDLAGHISFINPPLKPMGTKGLYYNIETDKGTFKIGANANLYINHKKLSMATGDEINNTLIGSYITMPSSSKAPAGNGMKISDADMLLMCLMNLKAAYTGMRQYLVLKSNRPDHIDKAIEIFNFHGLRYIYAENKKKIGMFQIYHNHNNIIPEITKQHVAMMSESQAKTFIEIAMLFDTVKISNDESNRISFIDVSDKIIHFVALIAMKAGYAVRWHNFRIGSRMKNCLMLQKKDAFKYHILSASISQHESEDKALWLPDLYTGLIVVNNGRLVVMPAQRYYEENSPI